MMSGLDTGVLRRLQGRLAGLQCQFEVTRIEMLLRKYRPDQPRVPAGDPGGGQWTDGGGGGRTLGPRYASLRPRAGAGGTRRIGGRNYQVTPGQAAHLSVTEAQASALTREVRRHDPSWRPEPSLYEGVEGRILANEAEARQAAARLRELGIRTPAARPQEEALRPGGRLIGTREGRASADTRTCTPSEFRSLVESVSPGAQVVLSPPSYEGLWYRQPNGSVFGLRLSEQYGMTYDVIRNDHPIFRPGFKVHQK